MWKKEFAVLFIFHLIICITVGDDSFLGKPELIFQRDGMAWDEAGKEYPPHTPVPISGGWRVTGGNFINHAEQEHFRIQNGEYATPVMRFQSRHHPKGGAAFDAKGSGVLSVTPIVNGKELPGKDFPLTVSFRRCKIPVFAISRKNKSPEVQFRFSSRGEAHVRRFQVEENTAVVSTPNCAAWVPGGAVRAAEGFRFSNELQQITPYDNFTIYFRFSPLELGRMQVIFEQTLKDAWHPLFQFSIQNGFFMLGTEHGKKITVKAKEKAVAGKIYEVFLTRSGGKSSLFINGLPAAELTGIPEGRPWQTTVGTGALGCSLDGVLHETLLWSRALSQSEIKNFDRSKIALPKKDVIVKIHSYILHLARGDKPSEYTFSIENTSGGKLGHCRAVWRIGSCLAEQDFGTLQDRERKTIKIKPSITLPPGSYEQTFSITSAGRLLFRKTLPLTVTPAPERAENLQVSSWWQMNFRNNGFTMGMTKNCADAMQRGMRWGAYQLRYTGTPRGNHPEDKIVSPDGKRTVPDNFYSSYMREQLRTAAERLADELAFFPALNYVDVNNEYPWYSQANLNKKAIYDAKEKYGLNLLPWTVGAEKWKAVLPGGRLSARYGGYQTSRNRTVELSDPFYRWHIETKGENGNMDTYTDRTLMRTIKMKHPRLKTFYAPVIRRIPVPGFGRELDIASSWIYEIGGFKVVYVQEYISALVRKTPETQIAAFPAFLPRSVGPYSSYPTPDMMRAMLWSSLLYPVDTLLFFQSNELLEGRNSVTREELNEMLGTAEPAGSLVEKYQKDRKTKIILRPAGLQEAFVKFLTSELRPFKALIPQWKTHPRRIALYISFASQLFSEERWPAPYNGLGEILTYAGVPYDILLDDDFIRNPDVLKQYNVICLPSLHYAVRPAAEALKRFAADPSNKILLSSDSKFRIPGAIPVSSAKDSRARLKAGQEKILSELQKKYGGDAGNPQYVEAVEERFVELAAGPFPDIRKYLEKQRFEVRSLTPNTFLNFLYLDSTNYIGIVNDKRTWGPEFGYFRKIPEKGVPQNCTIRFASELGAHAYDLVAHRKLDVSSRDGYSEITVSLGGGDCAVIMLRPAPLTAELSLRHERKNGFLRCIAEIGDRTCSMPAYVEIDGADDYSGAALFRNGVLVFEIPDDPAVKGFSVEECITGKKTYRSISK